MRLLFDHNLSHRLVAALADVFPGSRHVREIRLDLAPDSEIQQLLRSRVPELTAELADPDAAFLELA